jgi:hypothetical protein
LQHFYTTDFFCKSAFNESQILSVYYLVKPTSQLKLNIKKEVFDFDSNGEIKQAFRWKSIEALELEDVTFPTDQRVVELLKEEWQK